MAQKPETNFRNNVVKPFLKTLLNTHVFPISQTSIRGTPDLIMCMAGRFVAMELKSGSGVLSALQRYNLDEVTRCKGVSIVASPRNWDEVKKLLKQLDEGG